MRTGRSRHPRTFETMVRMIRDFLLDDSIGVADRRRAWDVLSALRGPDNGSGKLKTATTAVIRSSFFGKHARACFPHVGAHVDPGTGFVAVLGVQVSRDTVASVGHRVGLSANEYGSHFVHHAEKAFGALGLGWDRRNP